MSRLQLRSSVIGFFILTAFFAQTGIAMAGITVSRYTVAKPTNVTATAIAGGNLETGKTYYYRVISFWNMGIGGHFSYILSEYSNEVSATTNAANKTIALNWDDMTNANGYIIQRSETSGVYTVGGANTLRRVSQGYRGSPCAVNASYFNDDGGALYNWSGVNCDYSQPNCLFTCIGASTSDIASMSEVYSACVTNGWTELMILAPTDTQNLNNSVFRKYAGYFLRGDLYVNNCNFTLPRLLYTYGGTIFVDSGTEGYASYSHLFETHIFHIHMAPPDMSSISYPYNDSALKGTSNSVYTKVVRRGLTMGSIGYAGTGSLYDDGTINGTYNYSILGYGSYNAMPCGDGAYNECIFESLRLQNQGISDAIIWGGSVEIRWTSAIKINGIRVTENANDDIKLGGTHSIMLINPVFEAQSNSTQRNPYISMIIFEASTGHGLDIAATLNLKVQDVSGSPINGATITITDKNGANALWEDSLAILAEDLDKTDTGVNVSDGTKFSVGDYIRCELNSEIMEVTAISSNTLTVQRAQQGTVAQYHSDGNTNKVLKNVVSLTTDANGEASPGFPLIDRYLEIVWDGGYEENYEDNLAASNNLVRYYYSPHTVTISKAGYGTRTIQYTMDRKREEVEELVADGQEGGTVIYDSTIYDSTIY